MATAPQSARAALRAALHEAQDAIVFALKATMQATELGASDEDVAELQSNLEEKLALINKRIVALGNATDIVNGPTPAQVDALKQSVINLRKQNVTAAAWKGIVEDALDISAQVFNLPGAAQLASSAQPASEKPVLMQPFRGALRIRSDRIVTTPAPPPAGSPGRVGTMANAPAPPAAPIVTEVKGDDHLTKLAKLFPAEVLSIYPAGAALLVGAGVPTLWFVIGCALAIILVRGVATMPRNSVGPAQKWAVTVSVVSFFLWILAIGDLQLWWVETKAQSQAIAGAFAALWTWVTPAFVKGD
jgi:hypothetical protein